MSGRALVFSQWPDSELDGAEPLSAEYMYTCCLGTRVQQMVLEDNTLHLGDRVVVLGMFNLEVITVSARDSQGGLGHE